MKTVDTHEPNTEIIAGLTPPAGLPDLVASLPNPSEVTIFLTQPLPAADMHELILGADQRPDGATLSIDIKQAPTVGPNAVTIGIG